MAFRKFAIPMTFILAGLGMLLQLPVDQAGGSFYQNVLSEAYFWNLSHIILLLSVALMIPAGMEMYDSLENKAPKILGAISLGLLLPTAIFQAGQYAIDFVAPISAQIGGQAIEAYNMIDQTMPAAILFYGLSNLSILMLLLLSISMVWNGNFERKYAIIFMVNWVFVLIGNLIDPAFQRTMILCLGLTFFISMKSNSR